MIGLPSPTRCMLTAKKTTSPEQSDLAALLGKDDLAVVPVTETSANLVLRPNAHMGPGHATRAELALYLGVNPRSLRALIEQLKLKPTAVGKFRWADIWLLTWGIGEVPPHSYALMKSPLLSNADIARRLDVHERSIKRDGDRPVSRHGMPAHLDLSVRIRRHHPMRIAAWEAGVSSPAWLNKTAKIGGLRLVPRKAASSSQGSKMQVSDSSEPISQFDKHSID